MSNIGYGQDRLYGAIDDDDDFIDEWRSSWVPAAHTRVNEVVEAMTIEADHDQAAPADETSAEPVASGAEPSPEHEASGQEPQPEASGLEPEPEVPAGEPAAEAEEPGAEPLVAPDDPGDLDLVDWEPQPTAAPGSAPVEVPSLHTDESVPTAEPDTEEEPDHSLGLTGAAAAALAAASAWGVWGGTSAVPSMPAPSPFAAAEAEPESPAEPEQVVAQAFEPGLYVPEPEVLSIPEPQASGDEPEPVAFAPDVITTPIPEPDMYAAPGMSPFHVPEPEPYVIPEPEPTSEPSQYARPTGDTTPIPEPGSTQPDALPGTDLLDPAQSSDAVTTVLSVPPERVAHEQVHAAASASAAYDLRVDVFAVLGFPTPEEPTDASQADIDPPAQAMQASEEVARASADGGPSLEGPPTTLEDQYQRVDEQTFEPGEEQPFEPGQPESEHSRWFERAKMWAANNLYDPDEDVTPARPQDEQNR